MFQITVEVQGEVVTLVDGVTQDGEVNVLQTSYYKLLSPSEQQDVEFSILTLSGSVNVYVIAQNDASLDYDEPSSHTLRLGHVHVCWSRREYANCFTPIRIPRFLHHGGQYNIAVYGRSGPEIRYFSLL